MTEIEILRLLLSRCKTWAQREGRPWVRDWDFVQRSPFMLKQRREVWERSGGICEHPNCTRPAAELHHRNYADGDRPMLGDLTALCRICHRRTHIVVVANDNQMDLFKDAA